MGEPGVPSNEERALRRHRALAIVDSVRNDTEMPLPEDFNWPAARGLMSIAHTRDAVEQLAFELAQEICMLRDQLEFIDSHALTAVQSVTPNEVRAKMLWEIKAACRGELPDWWTEGKSANG